MLKVDKYGMYYEAPDPDDEIDDEIEDVICEDVIAEKKPKKLMGRPKRKHQ